MQECLFSVYVDVFRMGDGHLFSTKVRLALLAAQKVLTEAPVCYLSFLGQRY